MYLPVTAHSRSTRAAGTTVPLVSLSAGSPDDITMPLPLIRRDEITPAALPLAGGHRRHATGTSRPGGTDDRSGGRRLPDRHPADGASSPGPTGKRGNPRYRSERDSLQVLSHCLGRQRPPDGFDARAIRQPPVCPSGYTRAPATTRASAPTSAPASVPVIARAVRPVNAVSFDPYRGGPDENSQLAPYAIDKSLAADVRGFFAGVSRAEADPVPRANAPAHQEPGQLIGARIPGLCRSARSRSPRRPPSARPAPATAARRSGPRTAAPAGRPRASGCPFPNPPAPRMRPSGEETVPAAARGAIRPGQRMHEGPPA